MGRSFHVQIQRRCSRRAAALQDSHCQAVRGNLERDPQRGGRRFMRCRQGTENCHESRARFCGERKAAQFCIPRFREPCHEAPAACGAQRLLRSPERIPATGRSHHCKVAEVNAGR